MLRFRKKINVINNLKNASLFTEMAIKRFTKKNDTLYLVNSLINNAKINIKKNNFPSAKKDLDLAKSLIIKQEVRLDYLDIYTTEIEFYKKIKNNNINCPKVRSIKPRQNQ